MIPRISQKKLKAFNFTCQVCEAVVKVRNMAVLFCCNPSLMSFLVQQWY